MVVEEAKSTNNQIAARNHSLDDRLVRRWRKEEAKLREMCDTKRFRMDGAGRKIQNSELGMLSLKKSLITIFVHNNKIKNFYQKV